MSIQSEATRDRKKSRSRKRYLELSQSRGGQITELASRIGQHKDTIRETTKKISARRKIP
jgi:hypothetical protein